MAELGTLIPVLQEELEKLLLKLKDTNNTPEEHA